MFKAIGTTQLADLLIEMDAYTGFSETLLARRARDANERVSLYAALIAHGTDLDAKSVVAMVPQLDLTLIATAMRALEMPGRLSRANERVVEFQRTHPITELWGTRRHESSDSMSLDASPHLIYARVDPRRRTHAVGICTHVLDQHGLVYIQPIVLNERQAGVAIEGVLRHNENRDDGGLLRLSIDTHGYTSVGMAVSKLLGFDLCPSLRNLAERKVYLPRGIAVSEGLAPVVPTTFRSRQFATAGTNCCGSSPRFSPAVSVRWSRCTGSAVPHKATRCLGPPINSASCCARFSWAITSATWRSAGSCIRC